MPRRDEGLDEVEAWAATCVRRVGEVACALPEVREEDAWVGVRWRIRTTTFAHVYPIRDGRPQGSAAVAGIAEPAVVMTFRAPAAEAEAFAHLGPPWFKPPWSATACGLVLDAGTDWAEVAEVVTDSYRLKAPKRLVRGLDPPAT